MICRDIISSDGNKLWLLISQVEHARISGELTRQWNEPFTQEVIDAITHHDDGWAAWEAAPKLDPAKGRPFTFLEMPLAAALAIWDASIASARQKGPLAGWLVAGHFYALLSESDHAGEPLAAVWLSATRKRRTSWIDEWLRADPLHTLDDAKRAQTMIGVADLLSLWLCCDCPVANNQSILGQSSMKPRAENLLGRFKLCAFQPTMRPSPTGGHIAELAWSVVVEPYPLRKSPVSLSAASLAAPVSRYASWEELSAATWPVAIRWQLISAVSPNGSAG